MTNLEFENLLQMKKVFVKDNVSLPSRGEAGIFDLKSKTTNDKFYLDVDRRGRIEFSKFKIQNRFAGNKLPLVRIDIDSAPHMNPDGSKTSRNHIHIFKEMENDTGNLPWAYSLEDFEPINFNRDCINFMEIFSGFCEYCNIIMNNIQGGDIIMAQLDIDFSKQYLEWLKQNIEQYQVRDSIFRITLPFLDRNNDCVEVYIVDNGDGTYQITDDGATINDLEFSGFDIETSERRKKILNSIIAAYGITRLDTNELVVKCTRDDLPLKKHMLAQCMVKVSDMFYLSKNTIQSVFLDDVQSFFDANDVRYVDNICLTGKSKLTTHYDFAIARSKKSAERFIKVVNNMDLNAARNIIFAWNDTKDMRQPEAKLYAFIQNTDKKISDDAIGALKEYEIKPALWSKKDSYISELIA